MFRHEKQQSVCDLLFFFFLFFAMWHAFTPHDILYTYPGPPSSTNHHQADHRRSPVSRAAAQLSKIIRHADSKKMGFS